MNQISKNFAKETAGAIFVVLAFTAIIFAFGGCVSAVDHAGEYSSDPADLFGPWSLRLREASGATSYSVMDFSPTGCLYDELVRLDAAGNVESRTVYKGTWEPGTGTVDLREPGEPEVVDHYELRGDELVVDGVSYHRGRAVPPTLVGRWASDEGAEPFELRPSGVASMSFETDPPSGLDTTVQGFWWVEDGKLVVHIGFYSYQKILSVDAYQLRLQPGGVYDLIPNNSP
jgi:hypothetical protein